MVPSVFLLLHYLCLYTLKFPLGERLPVLTWDSRVSFPRAKTPSVAPHILDNGNRVPSLPGRSERFRGKGLPLEGGWRLCRCSASRRQSPGLLLCLRSTNSFFPKNSWVCPMALIFFHCTHLFLGVKVFILLLLLSLGISHKDPPAFQLLKSTTIRSSF